jgi:ribonucleoside-diphosphate reductase alpha chain
MARSPTPFTAKARTVLVYRYVRKDEQEQVVETSEEMLMRVTRVIAAVEQRYPATVDLDAQTAQYYDLMAAVRFVPNAPTLMHAGTPLGPLAACFVLRHRGRTDRHPEYPGRDFKWHRTTICRGLSPSGTRRCDAA